MAMTHAERAAQAQYDAINTQYMASLYAKPCDHQACLETAQQLRTLAQGTRLEPACRMRVERHQRKING